MDELLEQSTAEDAMFHIMKLVLYSGNKALIDKRQYIQKKWYHLKSSNLSEQEYRMKEKSLQRDEIDEINEIKEDILNKLAASKIRGFETKDMLLEKATQDFFCMENDENELEPIDGDANEQNGDDQINTQKTVKDYEKVEFDEDSWLDYRKNQLLLLDNLLNSSYFVQSTDRLQIDGLDDDPDRLDFENFYRKNSRDKDGQNDVDGKAFEFEQGEGYNRREKRAMNIKLSRYIGKLTDSHESRGFVKTYTDN